MPSSIPGINAKVCLTCCAGLFYQLCLNRVQVNFDNPSVNAQVIFFSKLCNAWVYTQGFLPTPFEWSIGLFLIPRFNAQVCLILHTGLFYLFLNRAGHFSYPGFNA